MPVVGLTRRSNSTTPSILNEVKVTMELARAWVTSRLKSRACRTWGSIFVVATMLLGAYYDLKTFRANVVYSGQRLMLYTMSTLNAFNEAADWTYAPVTCNWTQLDFVAPVNNSPTTRASSNNNKDHLERNGYTKAVPPISLEEAFFERMRTLDVSQSSEKLTARETIGFKTKFLPNNNYLNFPLLTMENVCMDPTGALVLINTTEEEIQSNISGPAFIPELYYLWNEIYACNGNISNDNCAGVTFASSVPGDHTLIRGATAHMLAYIGNSMHNWAERTWPFVMAGSPPIKGTASYPINNYVIHRFEKWLFEAKHVEDRAQLLWQFRMAMEMSGSLHPTYILVKNQTNLACFERLLLQQHARERIDETRLPVKIAGPAVKKYRDATFAFFGMPKPEVTLPPHKLRVLFYGRNDTSRRRVVNQKEVIGYLQNFPGPPLEVYVLDEMLAMGQTNYTFSELIRIFSQTDILVIAHGANTWATFLLPEGAGVVEIFGPCNWSWYNYTDLQVMHTWMHVNAAAAMLKHDISNPFIEAVPNPKRGNTTECQDPYWGIPDYTIDVHKLGKIINSFAFPNRACDRLTQHWIVT